MSARHRQAKRRLADKMAARGEAAALRTAYAIVIKDAESKHGNEIPPGFAETLIVGLTALEALAACRVVEMDLEIQADEEQIGGMP